MSEEVHSGGLWERSEGLPRLTLWLVYLAASLAVLVNVALLETRPPSIPELVVIVAIPVEAYYVWLNWRRA